MSRFPKDKSRVWKILFLMVAAAALALPAFSQQVDTAWVRRYNGPGNGDDRAVAIAVDSGGNVYVTGSSFDSTTGYDYCTIKYLPNGDTAWVHHYNGPVNDTDLARAMVLDKTANVYITGVSHGSITTVKYDSAGNLLWVDSLPTNVNFNRLSISGGYALALDKQGNVYVTGQQWDLDSVSWFVVKYDPFGDRLWYRIAARTGGIAFGLAVDSAGNSYVCGETEVLKYDSQGNLLWSQSYFPGRARAVALDSSGNVYVTGYSPGVGYGAYKTIKFDSNGNQLWLKEYDSPGQFGGFGAYAMAVDADGSVYVTGATGDGEAFYPITIKYDSMGNLLWHSSIINTGVGYAIALDYVGGIYVTGFYETDKYGSAGNQIWRKEDFSILLNALSLDHSKNVYAAGYLYGYLSGGTGDDFITIKYSLLPQLKGDLNLDGVLSPADVVDAVNCTFLGQAPPAAPMAADLNCDGKVTPADVVILLNMVFLSAPAPC